MEPLVAVVQPKTFGENRHDCSLVALLQRKSGTLVAVVQRIEGDVAVTTATSSIDMALLHCHIFGLTSL